MPRRKKIPSLKDLCINNITQNIVTHGERLKKCREEGRNDVMYKVLQSLFTDALLQKLLVISQRGCYEHEKMWHFINYVFLSMNMEEDQYLDPMDDVEYWHCLNKTSKVEDWPCLEFFFNEYTTCLLPAVDEGEKHILPKEVLSYIFSKCKNLRRLTAEFPYKGDRFLALIPQFQNLQDVYLNEPANNNVLAGILTKCLLITKLSVFHSSAPAPFSSEFLLALCKHHSQGKNFEFCPESGTCSEAGKRLRSLHIAVPGTTEAGVACALQHLPLLESFTELPASEHPNDLFHKVGKGIMLLQEATAANGRPPLNLQLKKYPFTGTVSLDEIRAVFLCCPKLECVQVNLLSVTLQLFAESSFPSIKELHLNELTNRALNSTELKNFLLKHGKEIEILDLRNFCEDLDLRPIHNILEMCCSLKELSLWYIKLFDEIVDWPRPLPSCIPNLEVIVLYVCGIFSTSRNEYIYELLCQARSVKSITIFGIMAEDEFASAMEINDFHCLEKLHIRDADIANIPLEKLLNSNNNIRKIHFHFCQNQDVALYKETARENNYDLEISSSISMYGF